MFKFLLRSFTFYVVLTGAVSAGSLTDIFEVKENKFVPVNIHCSLGKDSRVSLDYEISQSKDKLPLITLKATVHFSLEDRVTIYKGIGSYMDLPVGVVSQSRITVFLGSEYHELYLNEKTVIRYVLGESRQEAGLISLRKLSDCKN